MFRDFFVFFEVLLGASITPLLAHTYWNRQLIRKIKKLHPELDRVEHERIREERYPREDYYIPVGFITVIALIGMLSLFWTGFDAPVNGKKSSYNLLTTGVRYMGNKKVVPNNALEKEKNDKRTEEEKILDYYIKSIAALRFGFLGACIFSLTNFIRRYITMDLPPRVYYAMGIRVIVACAIALMIRFVTEDSLMNTDYLPALFFMIGLFPESGLEFLKTVFKSILGIGIDKRKFPLTMIEGISVFHEYRLREEGIDNVQNLATADLEDLVFKTSFCKNQVKDWISQSKLCLHFEKNMETFRDVGIRNMDEFLLVYDSKAISDALKIPADRLLAVGEVIKTLENAELIVKE